MTNPKLLRIKRRHTPQHTSQVAQVSSIDKTLSRVANASQLGLLLLAVFGYFYTVIPLYQKALLDEEIAKKNLELISKDEELRNKMADLAKLNQAVSKAKEMAHRSQIEIGHLKGTVREQYEQDIRPRLAADFQGLSSRLCSLESIPEGGLSKCIRDNVLSPDGYLSALTIKDRKLLQSLVDRESKDIQMSWKKSLLTLQERIRQSEIQKKDIEAKCKLLRDSNDYKDQYKKITIDSQCKSELSKNSLHRLFIDMDRNAKDAEILNSGLEKIAQDFISKASYH